MKDITIKGFIKFSEPEALGLINVSEFRLLNTEERSRDNGEKDIHPELKSRMNIFAQYLTHKYILPEWPTARYNKFLIWDGVDADNQGWHTDMFEGYDIFFLYYFDTQHPDTGGSINFKWRDDTGTEQTAQFYPQAGDLFMVNNCRGFWHRAESTKITRRVASFDFNVGLIDD